MGKARPSRVDHGHEYIRDVAYRERGRALRELRASLAAVLAVDPVVQFGSADFDCHYCECGACGSWWATRPEEVEHATSCPWVRAHEALGRWADINDTDAE